MTKNNITYLPNAKSQPSAEFLQLLRDTANAARKMRESVEHIDMLLEKVSPIQKAA